ncbi:MAG: hypothetical protein HYT19_01900, partial [Candidatus Nealsonbacteria bacterium]|nr:hypothetical protein [Candidatus Nealsonbacteria bacterium]
MVYDKEIRFKQSTLDFFVLGFLGIAVLSAIFSVDKSSSLYGFYGRFNGGLIGLLSFGALYFLITNNVGKEKIEVSKLLKLFLWSAAAVVLTGYFSVFGLWGKISGFLPLPKLMFQKTFNLTAGSLEGLSVFLAMVIALLAGKLLVTDEKKIVKILLLLASLGLMVVIDFNMAWLILLASLLLTVGFSIWKRLFRKNVNRLLMPIVLMIISAIFIFYSPSLLNLPKEQVLSQGISWQVGFKAAVDNVKNGFLGSGPATFFFDFAEHKPLAINQSWFWQIRFDTAGSYMAELLGTLGFVGIISYLALIGMFLLVSWFIMGSVKGALKDDKEGEERNYLLPILMVFLSLLAGQF